MHVKEVVDLWRFLVLMLSSMLTGRCDQCLIFHVACPRFTAGSLRVDVPFSV